MKEFIKNETLFMIDDPVIEPQGLLSRVTVNWQARSKINWPMMPSFAELGCTPALRIVSVDVDAEPSKSPLYCVKGKIVFEEMQKNIGA